MSLDKEIKDNEKKISTTEMKMSIGEIINLYKDEDIILNPEFQRLFRWTDEQKSRLIESILIGIPLPSIFVQQIEDGRWEIIDGLQRISTILEFVGELKNEKNEPKPASKLKGTELLPSLNNVVYESNNKNARCFDRETKLIFKRTPLIIQVVKRDSDSASKYELFDRLNSGGSPITNQELRNAIFLQDKPYVINFLNDLSDDENFQNISALSDRQIKESYDKEIILRFFAYNNKGEIKNESLKKYLDNYMKDDISESQIPQLKEKFKKLFKFLNDNFEHTIFRRKNKYGKSLFFKISIFEGIVIGLYDIKYDSINIEDIQEKIKKLDDQDWFRTNSKQGAQSKKRINTFLERSKKYFNN